MRIYKWNKAEGVMLSPSKHGGQGLSAHTLRLGDNALLSIIIALFCIFLSVNVLAQNSDTSHKDTSTIKIILDGPRPQKSKALIVIDGIIYEGDIKNIDPKDILSVDVLKNPGAANIYGPIAANGAILITTKRYHKTETTKVKITDPIFDKLVFVIDGIASDKEKLSGIDPRNIIIFDDSQIKKDTVIIVTKAFANNQYQKKFSAVSIKYKDHLEHQNNDDDISYILNGVFLSVKPGERTKELYELPAGKIKSVDFIENPYYNGGDSRKYITVITTKK